MAIGSGMGSSFGIAVQTSSYTTRVAPDTFFVANSYSINRTQNRVQGEGILGGNFGDLLDHYVETINGAEATVSFDVQSKKMGKFLNVLMGGTVTATQIGTTGAYTQTHTISDPLGKYLTMQIAAPYRTGTNVVHELVGGKVLSTEFQCDLDGILTCNAQIDGYSFDATQSLASPSWASTQVFSGKTATFKLGASIASASSISGVRSFSCTVERASDTEDYTFDQSGRKKEPVLNGPTKITGSVTVDWLDKTVFQDRVEGNTSCALVFEVTAATVIGGSSYPTFRISLPSVVWSGDMQGVDSKDVLQSTWDFEWKYDGTNLPYITYISADTTL